MTRLQILICDLNINFQMFSRVLLAGLSLLCLERAISAVEVIKREQIANYNYSLFTGYLFTQQNAVCFTDNDHPLLGFMDIFADSANPIVTKQVALMNYHTMQFNFTDCLVYFDLAYKSLEQRITVGGNTIGSVSISQAASGPTNFNIYIGFENSACNVTASSVPISATAGGYNQTYTCTGPTGAATITLAVTGITAYTCTFNAKSPFVSPNMGAEMPGYRIDWNLTLEVAQLWKTNSFGSESYSVPADQTIQYNTMFLPVDYWIYFQATTPVAGQQLRVSVSEFGIAEVQKDPACQQRAATQCLQCRPNYMLINGECLCGRNATVEQVNFYSVPLPSSSVALSSQVNPSTFLQSNCRDVGLNMAANDANCETSLDAIIKNNVRISLNRSLTNGAILNLSTLNTNSSLPSIVSGCSGFNPTLRLYLVLHGRSQDVGKYGLSSVLLGSYSLPTTLSQVDFPINLNSFYDALNYYCQVVPLNQVSSEYDCWIRGSIGPTARTSSMNFDFELIYVNTSSFATGVTIESYVLDMKSTKFFYGAIYSVNPNIFTKVLLYNTTDPVIATFAYDKRFVQTGLGSIDKTEIMRFTFDVTNNSLIRRYSISSVQILAAQQDEPTVPYIGHTCNSTIYRDSFFQSAVSDCKFSLKANVTFTISLIMAARDPTVWPTTLNLSNVYMFEIYQINQVIALAGLSKTATYVVIILVLLSMTTLICWLAYKAGAHEAIKNIDLDDWKNKMKTGVQAGITNFKDMIKNPNEEKKQRNQELKEKLIKKDDDSKERRARKAKKNSDDEEGHIGPENLRKGDISEIKPTRKGGDTPDDSLLDERKGKAKGKKQGDKILDMLDTGNKKTTTTTKVTKVVEEEEHMEDYDEEDYKTKKVKPGRTGNATEVSRQTKDTSGDMGRRKPKKESDDEEVEEVRVVTTTKTPIAAKTKQLLAKQIDDFAFDSEDDTELQKRIMNDSKNKGGKTVIEKTVTTTTDNKRTVANTKVQADDDDDEAPPPPVKAPPAKGKAKN